MRTHYCEDTMWDYSLRGNQWPSWHDKIAPSKTKGNSVGIVIKRIDIPHLVGIEVFFGLVEANHKSMFSKVATQAVIQCAWTRLVQYYYYLLLAYRCTLLAILIQAAFYP